MLVRYVEMEVGAATSRRHALSLDKVCVDDGLVVLGTRLEHRLVLLKAVEEARAEIST